MDLKGAGAQRGDRGPPFFSPSAPRLAPRARSQVFGIEDGSQGVRPVPAGAPSGWAWRLLKAGAGPRRGGRGRASPLKARPFSSRGASLEPSLCPKLSLEQGEDGPSAQTQQVPARKGSAGRRRCPARAADAPIIASLAGCLRDQPSTSVFFMCCPRAFGFPSPFPCTRPPSPPFPGPSGEDSCWEQLVCARVAGPGRWQEEEPLPPRPHSHNLQRTHTFLIKFLALAADQAQLLKERLRPVRGPG